MMEINQGKIQLSQKIQMKAADFYQYGKKPQRSTLKLKTFRIIELSFMLLLDCFIIRGEI